MLADMDTERLWTKVCIMDYLAPTVVEAKAD